MLSRLQSTLTIFSSDALRLFAATFLAALPIGYLQIVLPIYFNQIGVNPRDIGSLYAVSSIVSAALLFVFGLLADRFGRKPFVIAGLLLPAFAYVLLLATTNYWLLVIAAGIGGVGLAQGVSGALSGAGFNALLAEKSTAENRTLVFSVGSAAWTSALMAGALLGGLPDWLQGMMGLDVIASYRPLFWLSLIVSVWSAVIILPLRETHRARSEAQHWRKFVPHRSVAPIIKMSVFLGLVGLGLGFVIELLPLWFNLKYGVSGDFLSVWYAISNALSLLTVYIVPKLTQRFGTARALMLTQGVGTFFLLAMIVAPTAFLAALLFVIRQFLMNLSWPVQQTHLQDVVVPEERGAGNSLAFGTWGLANSLSPTLGGEWLRQGFLSLPLLAASASYLLSVALFYAFFYRAQSPKES